MQLRSTLVLACACYTLMEPAHADTLRCGSALVTEGDSSGHVLEKCGQPTSKTTVDEPIWSLGANGNTYQSGTTQSELWRYSFGPAKFPAVVKITAGVVKSITFEKSRG
jgi:hypothetical protein